MNQFIRHFEGVEYDQHSLMWHHHRLKRSLMGPAHVEFNFRAFDRYGERRGGEGGKGRREVGGREGKGRREGGGGGKGRREGGGRGRRKEKNK